MAHVTETIDLVDDDGSSITVSCSEELVQSVETTLRSLTKEELEKLKNDLSLVSDFKQQKLEKEAQKNWDLFYKRNTVNFFKDRHWTTREFEELRGCREVLIVNLITL